MGTGYHVDVHGSVAGNVIVGDHNLIVNAASTSQVAVLQEALRPRPRRRDEVRVLPRRPLAPFGRAGELAAIASAAAEGTTLQVYGPSGIGKSTLLRQAAHDVAAGAGVVFVSGASSHVADLPQEIFEACYDAPGFRPGQAEMRRLLAGVRVCVVADDLDATPDQLASVADTVPDAAIVFSAPERQLWGDGRVIALSGLPAEAALALARREIGRDLTPPEAATVTAAWTASGGAPMAVLRAAASLAAGAPPATGPLGTGPLGTGPLGTGPLGTGPLGTGPLGTGPLGTGPLGTGPLGTGPGAIGPAGAGGPAGVVRPAIEVLHPFERDVLDLLGSVGRAPGRTMELSGAGSLVDGPLTYGVLEKIAADLLTG